MAPRASTATCRIRSQAAWATAFSISISMRIAPIDVEVRSFASIGRQYGFERATVKVDVENAEWDFLDGAAGAFERIAYLIIEVLRPAHERRFVPELMKQFGPEGVLHQRLSTRAFRGRVVQLPQSRIQLAVLSRNARRVGGTRARDALEGRVTDRTPRRVLYLRYTNPGSYPPAHPQRTPAGGGRLGRAVPRHRHAIEDADGSGAQPDPGVAHAVCRSRLAPEDRTTPGLRRGPSARRGPISRNGSTPRTRSPVRPPCSCPRCRARA